MIIMSFQDSCGRYITITGRDADHFALQVASAKDTIPERVMRLLKGFSSKEEISG